MKEVVRKEWGEMVRPGSQREIISKVLREINSVMQKNRQFWRRNGVFPDTPLSALDALRIAVRRIKASN